MAPRKAAEGRPRISARPAAPAPLTRREPNAPLDLPGALEALCLTHACVRIHFLHHGREKIGSAKHRSTAMHYLLALSVILGTGVDPSGSFRLSP